MYVVHIIKRKISDDAVVIWQLPAFFDVESSRQKSDKTLNFLSNFKHSITTY